MLGAVVFCPLSLLPQIDAPLVKLKLHQRLVRESGPGRSGNPAFSRSIPNGLMKLPFELHTTLPHTVRFLQTAEPLLKNPVRGLRLRQIGGGPGAASVTETM
jgi:hypothetical protein